MPKTEAEWEAQVKALEAEKIGLQAKMDVLSQEKATAVAQVEAHSTQIKNMEKDLSEFKAVRRKNIVDQIKHALPSFDEKDKSDEYLGIYLQALKDNEAKNQTQVDEHAIPAKGAPAMNSGKPTESNKALSTSQKMGSAFFK